MQPVISRLLYYLLLAPLSRLPLRILYSVADVLSWVLYHVFPYRREVLLDNFSHAFPGRSKEEQKKFIRLFYKHFAELAVETIRTLNISLEELNSRVTVTNPELLNDPRWKDRSLILVTSHYSNWEWAALQIGRHSEHHKAYGIYLPLNNKFFDEVIRNSRKKFGTKLISTREVSKVVGRDAVPGMFAFIADQNPSNRNKSEWIPFFGREVPVAKGPELFAKRMNAPVIYGHIEQIERGKFTITYELITDEPMSTADGEITRKYIQKVEEKIRKRPELWLWSHKRWKHKR